MPARCLALWLPATLPVSSFTSTPPSRENPRASLSGREWAKGVTTKPTPSTAVTASSRERTSLARSSAPIPWASAKAAQAYRLSKATSGLGSSPNRTGAGGRTRNMHVVAVGCGGVRALPRPRRRHRDLGPADRTAEAGDHGSATVPVRSLNSTIISSHTAVRVRSSRQKCCDRRASNTSSGVSCCSTQV